jgi:1-acyl-sn-glycerol-3-phosphate acyltransferase
MRWRADEVDEFGFDPVFAGAASPLLEFLFERYWRIEVTGLEHLPRAGRVVLVSNHAGMLPWDGLMLRLAAARAGREDLRFLVEDFFCHAPFLGASLMRLGGVRACQDNALRLLEQERALAVFPEGARGATKLFRDRYRLQRFGRGGFVKLAERAGAPILPVAMVGPEEIHPVLANLGWLARQVGLGFFPLTPTFPWLGPLGLLPLPSKWLIRFGPLLDTGARQAETPPPEADLAEQVRASIQAMLDELRAARGHPYLGPESPPAS